MLQLEDQWSVPPAPRLLGSLPGAPVSIDGPWACSQYLNSVAPAALPHRLAAHAGFEQNLLRPAGRRLPPAGRAAATGEGAAAGSGGGGAAMDAPAAEGTQGDLLLGFVLGFLLGFVMMFWVRLGPAAR